jgi:hypothetical protein
MFAFFNAFDWQHSVLLGGAIIGGVLVGVGILMESEKWSLAAILVLIGITLEPIFTIGLFVYDESLSRSQQSTIELQNSEIIALETQLAPASLQKNNMIPYRLCVVRYAQYQSLRHPTSNPRSFPRNCKPH